MTQGLKDQSRGTLEIDVGLLEMSQQTLAK